MSVDAWSDGIKNLSESFKDDVSLVSLPPFLPKTVTSLSKAFTMSNAGPGPNPTGLENWDTKNVVQMAEAFKNNASFDRDISSWDVSNTRNAWMNGLWGMFQNANGFTGDLSRWCVPQYSESPAFGALNAAALPVWGYCGTPEPSVAGGGLLLTFNGLTADIEVDVAGSADNLATIHWGDGRVSTTKDGRAAHDYTDAGPHQVIVEGELRSFRVFSDTLISVDDWGDSALTSLGNTFKNLTQVQTLPATLPATVTSLSNAFSSDNPGPGPNPTGPASWNTSAVKHMAYMAKNNQSFDQDLGSWDVSNTANSYSGGLWEMFNKATGYTGDLSNWSVPHYDAAPYGFGAPNAAKQPFWGRCGPPPEPDPNATPSDPFDEANLAEPIPGALSFVINSGDATQLYIDSTGGATVHWGDGTSNPYSGAAYRGHTYPSPGYYRVQITGDLTRFVSRNDDIVKMEDWGDVNLTSLKFTFANDEGLISVPDHIPTTVDDMTGTFLGNVNPTGIISWDTSRITVMDRAFESNAAFAGDLSGWCVTNIKSEPSAFGAPYATHPVWGTCP